MNQEKQESSLGLYWTPRILAMLFIAFLALFSLDVFDSASTAGEVMAGLLMHNIPVFLLIAVLIVSWKREIIGGIVFTSAGLIYILQVALFSGLPCYIALSWSLTIAGPAIIIGALFFLNWRQKKKSAGKNKMAKK